MARSTRIPVPGVLALVCVVVCLLVSGFVPQTGASDHADPVVKYWSPLDAGLTGLFVWPEGDRMVVVLATHRGLRSSPPYDVLPDVTFRVHMDLDSEVTYDDEAVRARYGGQVTDPAGIDPEVTLTFRLDENAELVEHELTGLAGGTGDYPVYAGVRDDPFIFPRFFGTNVIAMVTEIPFSAFPAGQRDWVIWATAERDGDQVDVVGRSNRTQQGRLDFLNTVPVQEHVEAVHDRGHKTAKAQEFLNKYLPPLGAGFQILFAIRHYDAQPDVMIFTNRYRPGFPNGRRLTDDVAALTCSFGDCVLQEISYIEGDAYPRETTNDKEFLDEFPYLAEPWPEEEGPAEQAGCCCLPALLIVVAFLLLVWLWWRWRKKRRARLK